MSKDIIVDAVFTLGDGTCYNDTELKYALRNIEANCPFIRNVYIVGQCPAWIDTTVVKHIECPDAYKHSKYANIIDKLLTACLHEDIAKNILFCADDQFVTRKCTWDDFQPRWLRKYMSDDGWYNLGDRPWHKNLRATLEREKMRRISNNMNTDTIYYYQPNMYMQIDRDKFIEYARWSEYKTREDIILSSGYQNFAESEPVPNFDHSFIKKGKKTIEESYTHIGYDDDSFAVAAEYLIGKYPKRSKYENSSSHSVSIRKGTSVPDLVRQKIKTLKIILNVLDTMLEWDSLKYETLIALEAIKCGYHNYMTLYEDVIARYSLAYDGSELHTDKSYSISKAIEDEIGRFVSIYDISIAADGDMSQSPRYRPGYNDYVCKDCSRDDNVMSSSHDEIGSSDAACSYIVNRLESIKSYIGNGKSGLNNFLAKGEIYALLGDIIQDKNNEIMMENKLMELILPDGEINQHARTIIDDAILDRI